MWEKSIGLNRFVMLLSVVNFLLFHYPFFRYVYTNLNVWSINGLVIVTSLVILMLALNALVFYLLFYLSTFVGKVITTLFFILSAVSLYFVNTYHVIIDESMIGNVFNTKYSEASSFFSLSYILHVLFLGIVPSILLFRIKISTLPRRTFFKNIGFTFLFVVILIFINASNWLWIDKNSKTLGGLAMPWSYTVNAALFHIHQYNENKEEILLPNATIKDSQKSVVVLVIGESARRQNFSLYGYEKNTNPLLSKTPGIIKYNASSCATYTTAGLKCILEHENTSDLYEILPNYLNRNGVDVIWRTSNWGEPPVHIKDYQSNEDLKKNCKGEFCNYDEVLLNNLKERIRSSSKNKILIVLHTSTSHGPSYSSKYPSQFEVFKPVCKSVVLGDCSQEELINAYDNTILYTDYLLKKVIDNLKELPEFNSTMIFVSDHGESLGEKNLYMHGLPMSLAPKEQYEIPFIVWFSDSIKQVKPADNLSQNHVFHSVLKFLNVESPIYKEDMNIYK